MRIVDETAFGFGWIAPEPAFMQRTSHALVADGRVWIVDPVYDEAIVERIRGLGEPAAVVQLLDRHNRDCGRVARELGVPHHVLPDVLRPFEVVPVLRWRRWRENALWLPEQRVLVVPEAVGTAQYYRAPEERLAVSPVLRLLPPRVLLRFEPEHVLVGHGEGVHEGATAALRDAVTKARGRTPAWLWAGLRAHGPFRRR
jgi:hypothetical protein